MKKKVDNEDNWLTSGEAAREVEKPQGVINRWLREKRLRIRRGWLLQVVDDDGSRRVLAKSRINLIERESLEKLVQDPPERGRPRTHRRK